MSDFDKLAMLIVGSMLIICLLILGTHGPAHSYCADFTQCTPIQPRSDGALDPSTIIQQPLEVYSKSGQSLGEATRNPYDTQSMSNPYSPAGNQYSPSSLSNEWGAGNEYYGNRALLEDDR